MERCEREVVIGIEQVKRALVPVYVSTVKNNMKPATDFLQNDLVKLLGIK
jgi:hypothetical protein